MIISLKLALGIVFVFMLLYACFAPVEQTSGRKKIFLFIGIIPYAVASFILFRYLTGLFFESDKEANRISVTYSSLFFLPYLVGLIRIIFITGFGNAGNRLFDQHSGRKKQFNRTSKLIFSFHSLFFFIGGLIILIGVSMLEVTNESYKEIKTVKTEQWMYVSDDVKLLNEVSNHFYNLSTTDMPDTISFVFHEEEHSGWMINKGDSLSINYTNLLTALELQRDRQVWFLKVDSSTESEMWIELSNGSKQKMVREK